MPSLELSKTTCDNMLHLIKFEPVWLDVLFTFVQPDAGLINKFGASQYVGLTIHA